MSKLNKSQSLEDALDRLLKFEAEQDRKILKVHEGCIAKNNIHCIPEINKSVAQSYEGTETSFVEPHIMSFFQAVDIKKLGRITSKELQKALINADNSNFQESTCQIMIKLFDNDNNGHIDLQEFQQLFNYINDWRVVFASYDINNSGCIEEEEIFQAFQKMGYSFSHDFTEILIKKFEKNNKHLSFENFIVACILIRKLTNIFKKMDPDIKGIITIGFEEFIHAALCASSL